MYGQPQSAGFRQPGRPYRALSEATGEAEYGQSSGRSQYGGVYSGGTGPSLPSLNRTPGGAPAPASYEPPRTQTQLGHARPGMGGRLAPFTAGGEGPSPYLGEPHAPSAGYSGDSAGRWRSESSSGRGTASVLSSSASATTGSFNMTMDGDYGGRNLPPALRRAAAYGAAAQQQQAAAMYAIQSQQAVNQAAYPYTSMGQALHSDGTGTAGGASSLTSPIAGRSPAPRSSQQTRGRGRPLTKGPFPGSMWGGGGAGGGGGGQGVSGSSATAGGGGGYEQGPHGLGPAVLSPSRYSSNGSGSEGVSSATSSSVYTGMGMGMGMGQFGGGSAVQSGAGPGLTGGRAAGTGLSYTSSVHQQQGPAQVYGSGTGYGRSVSAARSSSTSLGPLAGGASYLDQSHSMQQQQQGQQQGHGQHGDGFITGSSSTFISPIRDGTGTGVGVHRAGLGQGVGTGAPSTGGYRAGAGPGGRSASTSAIHHSSAGVGPGPGLQQGSVQASRQAYGTGTGPGSYSATGGTSSAGMRPVQYSGSGSGPGGGASLDGGPSLSSLSTLSVSSTMSARSSSGSASEGPGYGGQGAGYNASQTLQASQQQQQQQQLLSQQRSIQQRAATSGGLGQSLAQGQGQAPGAGTHSRAPSVGAPPATRAGSSGVGTGPAASGTRPTTQQLDPKAGTQASQQNGAWAGQAGGGSNNGPGAHGTGAGSSNAAASASASASNSASSASASAGAGPSAAGPARSAPNGTEDVIALPHRIVTSVSCVAAVGAVSWRGRNPAQTKINQDSVVVAEHGPTASLLVAVFDGHGVNGREVSSFFKEKYPLALFTDRRFQSKAGATGGSGTGLHGSSGAGGVGGSPGKGKSPLRGKDRGGGDRGSDRGSEAGSVRSDEERESYESGSQRSDSPGTGDRPPPGGVTGRGMGRHTGAAASALCDIMADVLLATELALIQASGINVTLSGSTSVIVLIRDGVLHVCNVGDSRGILVACPSMTTPLAPAAISAASAAATTTGNAAPGFVPGSGVGPGGRPAGPLDSTTSSSSSSLAAGGPEGITHPSVRIRVLTVDHKPDAPKEKQRILSTGGRVMSTRIKGSPHLLGPPRVWLKNAPLPGLNMSRSLGDLIAKQAGVISTPHKAVHALHVAASGNDRALVLASDGLWDFVTNEEVGSVALSTSDTWEASARLARLARSRWLVRTGGADDTTVVIVRFATNPAALTGAA